MKKEVLLAITIGIILGLFLMGGLEIKKRGKISFPWINQSSPELPPAEEPEQALPPTEEKAKLEILEPEDETISSQEKITLKGRADSLATIIVIWEEGEDILVANEEGYFETEISLSPGPNEIEISAYTKSDQVAKKLLTITYSTAKF